MTHGVSKMTCSLSNCSARGALFISCLAAIGCMVTGEASLEESSNGGSSTVHSGRGGTNTGASGNKGGTGSIGTGGTTNGTGGSGSSSTGGSGNGVGEPNSNGGASGQTGGSSNGGDAGTAGNTGVSGTTGVAGSPGDPLDVSVDSHAFAVDGFGKVFNTVDNFFYDQVIMLPPYPIANFGFPAPMIPIVNSDGSLDIAWLDYSNGKGEPWGLSSAAQVNVTHVDPTLKTATTKSTGLKSYKLLGFTTDSSGSFYIAYTVDHPFKSSSGANNIDGNELHIAKFTDRNFGSKAWDTLVFGNQDNTKDLSKGDPGGAGSGVLGYDPLNKKLALYVAHSMAWGDNGVRHQAGYFRLFDPENGKMIIPSGNSQNMNSGWFYSHNFNQRLLIDNGVFYMLAHGDAYPRQLGFAAWTLSGYQNSDAKKFERSYFNIEGQQGANETKTETGQFIKLNNSELAIIHTTSQGRSARDVRIVTANASDGAVVSNAWLTTNTDRNEAIMPKLERLNDRLLVSYGVWNSSSNTNKKIDWYVLLVGEDLKPLNMPEKLTNVEFVHASPMFRFPAGPNAGKIGWVSGNSSHTLSVHVASTG